MEINYVTTNSLKFEIAKKYFDKLAGSYTLVQHAIDTPEIQNESVVEIARQSAVWAAKEVGSPCIKKDVGFFIPSLNGFPGPFVKYVNEWLTQSDYLKFMDGKTDRSAYFEDALAIGYPDGTSKVFSIKKYGNIATVEDAINTKWPANSLFIPNGYDKALGTMTQDEQHSYWGDGNWPSLVQYLQSVS